MRAIVTILGLTLVGCSSSPAAPSADAEPSPPSEAPEASDKADESETPAGRADPPGTYMGRTLAQTMSHLGAPWLTRPKRDAEENTTLMHEQLGLSPGDVACDVGAGNGYHTLRMAEAVGSDGKAIAVDLQPQMLERLQARATEAGIDNVQTIVAEPTDPKLPPGTCDLVLLVDVYHELSDPAAVLGHLSTALTPRGRIALLEFRAEDPDVPIKALHKMSKVQILAEYEANDLQLESQFDGLPWQHLMFFVPASR